eukprot:1810246-Pyramimonas_sp.AAC.1
MFAGSAPYLICFARPVSSPRAVTATVGVRATNVARCSIPSVLRAASSKSESPQSHAHRRVPRSTQLVPYSLLVVQWS